MEGHLKLENSLKQHLNHLVTVYKNVQVELSLVFKLCFWDEKGLYCELLTNFSDEQGPLGALVFLKRVYKYKMFN